MHAQHKFIESLPPNVNGRDFVIGDLHGCFDELAKLITYVQFDPSKDRLFSTGDLVDRGPRSKDCLSLLNKKWFFPVLGNHEDLALIKLKMFEDGHSDSFTKEDFELINDIEPYKEKIMKLPLSYEISHLLFDKIYIVHGEILPDHLLDLSSNPLNETEYHIYFSGMKDIDFSNQIVDFFERNKGTILSYDLKQKLIWSRKMITAFYKENRENIDNNDFSFIKDSKFNQKIRIFCGHNVVPFPMRIGQQYYIDTGAALGYATKEINSPLFSQFGHEFFTLSMVDLTTGICYGCVTSGQYKGHILKLEKSIYDY